MSKLVLRSQLTGEERTVGIEFCTKQEKYIKTTRWQNKTEWKIGDLVLFQPKDYESAKHNFENFTYTIITDIIDNKADLRSLWQRGKVDKKQTVWKNVPEEQLFHPHPDYKMEPSYQKYRMSVLQGKLPNIFDKYTQEDNPYLQFARLVVVDPVRKIEEQYFDEKKTTLTSQNQMEREIFKAIEKKITANPDFRRNVDSRANYLQQLGIPFDKQRAVKELGQHVYDEIPAKTAMLHVLYDKERIKYDYELLRQKINKNPNYESTLTKDELQLLEEGKRIDDLYDQYRQKAFLEQHKTAVKMLPQGATASEIEEQAEQLLNAPLKSESNMLMYVGIGVAALGIGFLYLKR